MELENNEEGNGKGNKKRIAIIAVVVAAIIAVVVAAFLLLSPHEPEASSIKDAATTTQEQLDEEAMKSRLWVSVANTIYADAATDTCYATDKDGNKRTSAEVVADNIYFGDSKRDGGDSSGYSQSFGNAPAPAANSYAAPASAPTSDFSMIEDDDSQLPF
mgnify:CR=1 FL=1